MYGSVRIAVKTKSTFELTVMAVVGVIVRLFKVFAVRPVVYILHVSTEYELVNDVIVMISLGYNVGGETIFEIPNEKADVVELAKIDEAVIKLLDEFPAQDILPLTKGDKLVQIMLVVIGWDLASMSFFQEEGKDTCMVEVDPRSCNGSTFTIIVATWFTFVGLNVTEQLLKAAGKS